MAWPKGLMRKKQETQMDNTDKLETAAEPLSASEPSLSTSPDEATALPAGMPDATPNAEISDRPTKPWERGGARGGSTPWRRDITRVSKKDRDDHCRWVNDESIEQRIERGYEIADPAKWGRPTDKIVEDGSPLGRRIKRLGMTLMFIPKEGKEYFENEQESILKARKRDARDMVKKQAEELLAKAGYAVSVVDKSKVERDGKVVPA